MTTIQSITAARRRALLQCLAEAKSPAEKAEIKRKLSEPGMDCIPKIGSDEFFSLQVVKDLQKIQQTHPYGSKQHRQAHDTMQELAQSVGRDIGGYDA